MSTASNPVGTTRAQVAGARTLRRGLAVVRLLTQVGTIGLRMGEIGRRLGLNKSTAARLTLTLVDEGFVVQYRATGRYRLGPEAFAAGLAAEPDYGLQRSFAPLLRALAAETGDTVFFTVLHGYESICLSRDEGDFPIRNQLIKPGDRWPLGVGAGSCALLAALSDAEIADVLRLNAALRRERFPRCTDDEIDRLVAETRVVGYCLQPDSCSRTAGPSASWSATPTIDRSRRSVSRRSSPGSASHAARSWAIA